MVASIQALKFPAIVLFMLGTVWAAAYERDIVSRAERGYLPALRRAVVTVVDVDADDTRPARQGR